MKNIVLYVAAGLAALLVVVGVGGGTAYLVMKQVAPSMQTAAAGKTGGAEVVIEAEGKNVLPLKPFVTNLADTDRPRYINVTFELISKDEAGKRVVEQNLPLVRDVIVGILNSKKSMEVTGEAGANTLKKDVMEKVNQVLGGRYVLKVLVTDFVVQF